MEKYWKFMGWFGIAFAVIAGIIIFLLPSACSEVEETNGSVEFKYEVVFEHNSTIHHYYTNSVSFYGGTITLSNYYVLNSISKEYVMGGGTLTRGGDWILYSLGE